MTLAELAAQWLTDAALLDEHGADQAAATARRHAGQLESALKEAADEELTLADAVRESGYFARWLRELVSEGAIPNAGEKGRPRIRRSDLPRKARAQGHGRLRPK